MKKIPLFWKIYIFSVTAIILLCCIFFIFFYNFLCNYEESETQRRAEAEIARIAEEQEELQRNYEAKNNAEREGGYLLSRRNELISAVKEAEEKAAAYADDAVYSSPERVMDVLTAKLNEKGLSAVSEQLEYSIGKYEKPEAVTKYADGLEGEYSYKKISDLEYTLKKDTLDAKVTLTEGQPDEKGHKTYNLSSVSLSVPLRSYRVSAPEGASVTANGITVDEEATYEKQNVSGSIPSSFSVPSVAYYDLDGFVNMPELKATLNGKECVRVNYADRTAFLMPSNDKYKTELYDRICELTFAYSDFVAGAFKFEDMKQYLYPKTKLYYNLSEFDNRWYYNYDHIINENAKITYLNAVSENLVFARIEYDQTLRNESDAVKFRIHFKFDVYIGCDKVPKGEDKSAWLLVCVESVD